MRLRVNLILFCTLFFSLILGAENISAKDVKAGGSSDLNSTVRKYGEIKVLVLKGSRKQMGFSYGKEMRDELKQSLAILKKYFIEEKGISYEKMRAQGNDFYNRYPVSFQLFLKGVSNGADMPVDDIKILNAMETMGELLPGENLSGKCAFISIPPDRSSTGSIIIGRNYDFPEPFGKIAKYLTVTILLEDNSVPTAFVSMPGQIYCPSCMNENGLFMELNNGMPSGGSYVDKTRESLLINMLQIMQDSKNLEQLEKQLNALKSDYSLIVNTADKKQVKSFEFSARLGMKNNNPPSGSDFVSTNYFLCESWKDIPVPDDASTWLGVTRRNNLLNLAGADKKFTVESFKALMDKNIKNGGALWNFTIYQAIFDSSSLTLYLKINSLSSKWNRIPLTPLFRGDLN